jgi:hypothetical protein
LSAGSGGRDTSPRHPPARTLLVSLLDGRTTSFFHRLHVLTVARSPFLVGCWRWLWFSAPFSSPAAPISRYRFPIWSTVVGDCHSVQCEYCTGLHSYQSASFSALQFVITFFATFLVKPDLFPVSFNILVF